MTSRSNCLLAERLAGAIAVGDASEAERDAYRSHVAVCARCVNELGGEREIERVMSVVGEARDDERWDPDLRSRLARRSAPRRAWVWGAALAAIAALVIGVRSAQIVHSPTSHQTIASQEARAIAALDTQTGPRREGRAESLTVGTTTISTSFAVSVDQRGVPVRCTITKSSGVRSLDESVCRAAMHAHYTP
jgi:hypothetical protein